MITIRAALAVALLRGYLIGRHVGFWGLATVSIGTWIVAPGWLPGALTGFAVVVGLLSVRAGRGLARWTVPEPVGVPIPPRLDSPLWTEVRKLCDRLRVRPPDEIRIGVDPVMELSERGRKLGLAAGTRRLQIGLPLLMGLSTGEFRALLTHELAHDSREAGTLLATCHRIRHTLGPLLQRRPATVGVGFAALARVILALEAPASRRQERLADRAAMRHNGRRSVAGMLREVPVLTAAWRRYLTEVVVPAARSGYAPLSISDGFNHMREAWRDELEHLRNAPPESVRPAWDVHQPRLERLHQIDLTPEAPDQVRLVDPRHGLGPLVRQVETLLVGPR
ncbi:MAG TPA: M48 family metallopeptidase, partial [Micromonosporaceae bacterium]|nr:M48 family metallopeptidase [Micromonosporaceae bacterium]